jgi:hypothetical protein
MVIPAVHRVTGGVNAQRGNPHVVLPGGLAVEVKLDRVSSRAPS